MKTQALLVAFFFLLLSPFAWAIDANSSWREIQRSQFYHADIPTISFKASTRAGSTLVVKKVTDLCTFINNDGEEMLSGGRASVCSRYSDPASSSTRRCLKTEKVDLVTARGYKHTFCTDWSSGSCVRWRTVERSHLLEYKVNVYRRYSVSDSFGGQVAFRKKALIKECN